MSTKSLLPGLLILAIGLPSYGQVPKANTPQQLGKIAGWKGAAVKSGDAFTFAIISDRWGGAIPGEWAAAIRQINLLQPHFVMSIGDLIDGYTEDEAALIRQWEEFDGLARKFDAPFFYCSGNHDVSRPAMLKVYRELHGVNGKTYYSFNYRGCHFVVLNSCTAAQSEAFAKEQFAWLANDLAAARSAEHIFVFYHYPLWEYPDLWNRMRAMLPAGKTTIFNGHWHRLFYREIDGFPTYVLASTGDNISGIRHLGTFRMFAHVAVDRGKPSVAVLPLHEVLSTEYARYTANIRTLSGRSALPVCISRRGGTFSFKQTNLLSVPVEADVKWQAPGWKVAPEATKLAFEAAGTTKQVFSLKPLQPAPAKPSMSITYRFNDPYTGQQIEIPRDVPLGTYAEMDIPRVSGIEVDGNLSDFSSVKPLVVADASRLTRPSEHWSGAKDGSFELQVATDGQRLFLAVEVTDDQINIGRYLPRRNDGIEFFWDAREPGKRDGRHGKGTGHLVLVVPEPATAPKPRWDMGSRPVPKGLAAVCKRTAGGYVYELSIPLKELAAKAQPATPDSIRLEIQLNDSDRIANKITNTYMTISGLGGAGRHTVGYLRCTLK